MIYIKGLYVCLQDFDDNVQSGVTKKILDQVEAFSNSNVNMKIIATKGKNIVEISKDKSNKIDIFKNKLDKRKKVLNNSEKLIKTENLDFVYIRYFKSDFEFIRFLKNLRKYVRKILIEIPTYPYENEIKYSKLKGKRFLAIIDKIFRKKLKKYVDSIVTFSQHENIFEIKTIKIENGINCENIYRKKNNDKQDKGIILLGVASLSFWHGYDRVIKGLSQYYQSNGERNIIFNIVGNGSELINLKKLVKKLNLDNKVIFKGVKVGSDLDEEFNNADIAIGSLAIHRIGLDSVSTLKLKEYCARGIPFIYAYNDNSFNNDMKFLLHFKADESYIDIKEIIKFNDFIKFNDLQDEMIRYSKNFSWDIQINTIIKNA